MYHEIENYLYNINYIIFWKFFLNFVKMNSVTIITNKLKYK